jgi:AcrR family transcriptional regulator
MRRASGAATRSTAAVATREPRAHARILAATRVLLGESGYAGVTMEAVAKRADVGKPTLYRWWPNKAALVHEALLVPLEELRFVARGSLAADLRAAVTQTVRFFARPLVRSAWLGVIADLRTDPRAWDEIYATFLAPAVRHMESVLADAVARGECRRDADARTVVDAILGMCIYEMLPPGPRARSQTRSTDAILRLVLHGVATPVSSSTKRLSVRRPRAARRA